MSRQCNQPLSLSCFISFICHTIIIKRKIVLTKQLSLVKLPAGTTNVRRRLRIYTHAQSLLFISSPCSIFFYVLWRHTVLHHVRTSVHLLHFTFNLSIHTKPNLFFNQLDISECICVKCKVKELKFCQFYCRI